MITKKIYIIALLSFITLIVWVVFDILHARENTQPSAEVQQVIEPLNPTFDQSAINKL